MALVCSPWLVNCFKKNYDLCSLWRNANACCFVYRDKGRRSRNCAQDVGKVSFKKLAIIGSQVNSRVVLCGFVFLNLLFTLIIVLAALYGLSMPSSRPNDI